MHEIFKKKMTSFVNHVLVMSIEPTRTHKSCQMYGTTITNIMTFIILSTSPINKLKFMRLFIVYNKI